MKILVVGKGGREHALIRALSESPEAPELYCFPGSDAIFELAKPVEDRDFPTVQMTDLYDDARAVYQAWKTKDDRTPY